MAIKNTKLGGTDLTDGAAIIHTDYNDTNNAMFYKAGKYCGKDQTGGTTAATVETEIGEVLVPAGACSTGALVQATIYCNVPVNRVCTIKIRTGTSATATSNTERAASYCSEKYDTTQHSVTVQWYVTEETFSNQWYAHITAQASNTGCTMTLQSLVVIGN